MRGTAKGKDAPTARLAGEASAGWRLVPFAAVGLVSFVVVALARGMELAAAIPATVVCAVGVAMVIWVPWRRLPALAPAVPALLFVLAVALVRDAAGGPVAGLGPLFLLPVLWIGLYGTRAQLALVVPGIALAFFTPVVAMGPPTYPASQWGVGVLYLSIALLIGLSVQRLIGRIQTQADEASRREREIARVADLARQLSSGGGTRRDVCSAATEIGDAEFSMLWEPDGEGRLAATAGDGIEVPKLVLDPSRERSAALTAFRTGSPIFAPDARTEAGINERVLALVPGAVSILFQPVLRHGEPVGVLVVGWRERVDHQQHRLRVLIELLAAEAGIAIERADLLTKLEELADTDELTGLPNRRAWNRELEVALSTAERRKTPLCVALIDVDHFKQLNDQSGHQAGDRLLKSAAAAWRSALRPADVLARPGGDEFTLVLPDCDVDRARMVVERIRAATPAGRTCSIGVAQWDRGESAEELVARVDDALYAAKQGGRDRVVLAPE
jgi:diguanylate cyclase (GGDEF)-like protein